MPEQVKLMCCNKNINDGTLWILQDIKGLTARKMLIGTCSVCGDEVVVMVSKRVSDGKIFVDNFNGIEAVKTIYREKRRKITAMPDIKTECLYGWIYGVNTQIKNKQGKITKIRQYSSDFSGKKVLSKEISL